MNYKAAGGGLAVALLGSFLVIAAVAVCKPAPTSMFGHHDGGTNGRFGTNWIKVMGEGRPDWSQKGFSGTVTNLAEP